MPYLFHSGILAVFYCSNGSVLNARYDIQMNDLSGTGRDPSITGSTSTQIGYHRNVRQTRHRMSVVFYTLVLRSYFARLYLTRELVASNVAVSIQGVTGGKDQTSGGCSLC